MRKYKSIVTTILCLSLLLGACGQTNSNPTSGSEGEDKTVSSSDQTVETEQTEESGQTGDTDLLQTNLFSTRDLDPSYDEATAATIQLADDASVSSSSTVLIDGNTITIGTAGNYILSGTLSDGQIVIDATNQDKIQLVLDGVTIHSETSAAIYVLQADKVFLTLADNSQNTLTNGGSFVSIDENNIDATIFSKDDLTINGSGALTIDSPAGHGIVTKDDLVLADGTYTITAAKQAFSGQESIRIAGGDYTLTAGMDALHAENTDDTSLGFIYIANGTFRIEADDEGISASSDIRILGDSFVIDSAGDGVQAEGSITVLGGTFGIRTGDDGFHADETLDISGGTIGIQESYEGLEALNVKISGGDIQIIASDDGINAAGGVDESGLGGQDNGMFGKSGGQGGPGGSSTSSNGSIVISGGTIDITAYGDGIDANGTLEISGGQITVTGPTTGDTSTLDYDLTGTITGGTFVGTGAAMMAQSFSSNTQGVIALSVGNQAAKTPITVTDSAGSVLLSAEPELDFAVVILSSPELVSGETYTVTVGTQSGEVEAN